MVHPAPPDPAPRHPGRRVTDRGAEPRRGPVLAAVGVLALLLVAAAAAAAVLLEPRPGDTATGARATGDGATTHPAARPAAGPPARSPRRPLARPLAGPTRVVAAGGVRFAVPRAPGWSVGAPGTLVGFDRASGTILGRPAFHRRGWCAGDPRWSNRALVGVVPPPAGETRGYARRVTRRTAARWRAALAAGGPTARAARAAPAGGSEGAHVGVRRVRLADGTAAWLATGRTPVPGDASGCAPPAVALAVLGVPVAGGVAHVVALRDTGVPGALPATVLRRVLAGVRAAGA